jgi:hypothetical protein
MHKVIFTALFLLLIISARAFVAEARLPQSAAPAPPESAATASTAATPEPNKAAEPHQAGSAARRDFILPLLFPIGERLIYEVKFSNFPISATVGEVTFEFVGGHGQPIIQGVNVPFTPGADEQLVHLRAQAVSKGLLTRIFSLDVNDRFETLVSARDFAARLSFKETQENKKHVVESAIFDRAQQAVSYALTDLNNPQAQAQRKELPRQEGMLDLLSAFYFVRLQRLREGQTLRFPVSNEGVNYQFEILVHQREKINTNFGKLSAIKLEPKLFGPGQLFSRPGEMEMWLTDDDFHIPVRLVAKTSAGTITATLLRVEHRCRRVKQGKNRNQRLTAPGKASTPAKNN